MNKSSQKEKILTLIASNNLDELKLAIDQASKEIDLSTVYEDALNICLKNRYFHMAEYLLDRGAKDFTIKIWLDPEIIGLSFLKKEMLEDLRIQTKEKNKDLKIWYDNYMMSLAQKQTLIKSEELIKCIKSSNSEKYILKKSKYWIELGANIHFNQESPLIEACHYGRLDIVKYLVEKNANFCIQNFKPITKAIENNHLNIIEYAFDVLENKKDLAEFVINYAAAKNKLEIIEFVDNLHLDNEWPSQSLEWASEFNYVEIVNYLLRKNMPQETLDYSLELASKRNHYDVVKMLLEKGANIEVAKEKGTEDMKKFAVKYKKSIDLHNTLNNDLEKNKIEVKKQKI